MRLGMGVVLLLGLMLPSTASATPMQSALSHAQALWKQTACLGLVKIVVQAPPNHGGDTIGEDIVTANPETGVTECQIYVDPGIVREWPWLCTLVMHEYGHLLGIGHGQGATREQRRVMSPSIIPDRRRCGRHP